MGTMAWAISSSCVSLKCWSAGQVSSEDTRKASLICSCAKSHPNNAGRSQRIRSARSIHVSRRHAAGGERSHFCFERMCGWYFSHQDEAESVLRQGVSLHIRQRNHIGGADLCAAARWETEWDSRVLRVSDRSPEPRCAHGRAGGTAAAEGTAAWRKARLVGDEGALPEEAAAADAGELAALGGAEHLRRESRGIGMAMSGSALLPLIRDAAVGAAAPAATATAGGGGLRKRCRARRGVAAFARLSRLDDVEFRADVSLAHDERSLVEGQRLQALHHEALLVRRELGKELNILYDLSLRKRRGGAGATGYQSSMRDDGRYRGGRSERSRASRQRVGAGDGDDAGGWG